MKRSHLWIVTVLLSAGAVTADINVRISVKAVLSPATGMRQPGVDETTFSNTVDGVNALLANLRRGYRLAWDGTITDVGGLGGITSGPSLYYDIDFHDEDNEGLKEQMEADAISDPAAFDWRTDSINLYITRYGGVNWNVCSFPDSGEIIIVNGVNGYASPTIVLHEIGHYFDLRHTFQGQAYQNGDGTPCEDADCGCAQYVGGQADEVADTKLDHRCWTDIDAVAQGNFGMNYAALNAAQTLDVDRIWLNIMSYHGAKSVLTPDQLDRWTNTANHQRDYAVSGRTWFVDGSCNNLFPTGDSFCFLFGGPFSTVADALFVADGNDIVLIRGGTYPEGLTCDTPAVMRATRGNAVLR